MRAATMGRDRRAEKIADASADPADSGKKISLKVSERSGQTVHKIAAHRGVSVESLFEQRDFEDFLIHALIEEMQHGLAHANSLCLTTTH